MNKMKLPSIALSILILCCLFSWQSCKKEVEPLVLRPILVGGWYADVVTQSGIDVTANYQYAFSFNQDSSCVAQRSVVGTPTQYVGTWSVDEDKAELNMSFIGWQAHWQLIDADTVASIMRFKDLDASAETIIELWRL
jgi:hypothetical protein